MVLDCSVQKWKPDVFKIVEWVKRVRKIWVILTSRKQSHPKIPWFFINFHIPWFFHAWNFFQPFSMFSRACGNPTVMFWGPRVVLAEVSICRIFAKFCESAYLEKNKNCCWNISFFLWYSGMSRVINSNQKGVIKGAVSNQQRCQNP